jgi:hypothetical protein
MSNNHTSTGPPAAWEPLDYDAFAEALGVTKMTLRGYLRDARANRRDGTPKPNDVPEPDYVVGGMPLWYRNTVDKFIAERGKKGEQGES